MNFALEKTAANPAAFDPLATRQFTQQDNG